MANDCGIFAEADMLTYCGTYKGGKVTCDLG